MSGRAGRRRGAWTPTQIEADELESFCLHLSHKELNASSDFLCKLFPTRFSPEEIGDVDESVATLSVEDREVWDAAVWSGARAVADRVIAEKSMPRKMSLKNIFSPKPKKGICERSELITSVESTVSAYIANDVVPLEIGQKTTASLSVDSYSYRGLKPTNEDRVISIPDVSVLFSALESDKFKGISLFGVYDGHGGETCADYVRTYLHLNVLRHESFFEDVNLALKEGFLLTNENYRRCLTRESETSNAGSTATLAIIKGDQLHVAWAGDSPAFLLTDAGLSQHLLNPPHNASEESERKRVEAIGGVFLKDNDSYRLNGSISVTRSFGDFRITCMTAEPDIVTVNLKAGLPISTAIASGIDTIPATANSEGNTVSAGAQSGSIRYIVVSSDGLTDVMTPEDVWKAVRVKEDPTLADALGTFGFDQNEGNEEEEEEVEGDDEGNTVPTSVEEGADNGGKDATKPPPSYPEKATAPSTTKVPLGTCEYITQAAVDFKNSMDNVSMVLVKLI